MSQINNSEQPTNSALPLTAQQVADYLLAHPEFFVVNPELLDYIRLPEDSGVVSLFQFQQKRSEKKQQQTQQQLQQLLAQARDNEKLFQLLSVCMRQLWNCQTLSQINETLQLMLNNLGLQAIALHGFDARLALPTLCQSEWLPHRFTQHKVYLGRLNHQEQMALFNQPCQSAALLLIGCQQHPLALLAFASPDQFHFAPEQDSMLLQEFALMLETRLLALLPTER